MNTDNFAVSLDIANAVLDQLPIGLVICDLQGNVNWSNALFAQYINEEPLKIVGVSLSALQAEKLYPINEDNGEFRSVNAKQGRERSLKRIRIDEPSLQQQNLQVFAYMDISEQLQYQIQYKEIKTQMRELTTVDAVSGLLNRRAMLQNLEPLVSRSRRYDNPLSVISMELINLEAIGDQHGVEAINLSVTQLSHLLKDQMRWADIVSRSGENLFVFILPETEKASAVHLANKINGHINELDIHISENIVFKLEACFGVSAWEKGNDSVLLLKHSQQALESAIPKGAGGIGEI